MKKKISTMKRKSDEMQKSHEETVSQQNSLIQSQNHTIQTQVGLEGFSSEKFEMDYEFMMRGNDCYDSAFYVTN